MRRRRCSPSSRVALVGAIGAALVSQHVYGMEPCPWCVLQRLIFLAIGAFALLGLVWRGAAGARVVGTFALLLAASGLRGGALAATSFAARSRLSCKLVATGSPVLPDVFEARAAVPMPRCRCWRSRRVWSERCS